MGFSKKSKTIQRDAISGLWVANDIDTNSEVSVNELNARMAARQTALNDAITADWSDPNSIKSPTYGNAMSRMPRPSDYVAGSKSATFGGSLEDDTNTTGGAPQKGQPAVKGIMPTSKGRG